jgi:hypothetical protein
MWIEVGVIPGSDCVPPKATGMPRHENRCGGDEKDSAHWD